MCGAGDYAPQVAGRRRACSRAFEVWGLGDMTLVDFFLLLSYSFELRVESQTSDLIRAKPRYFYDLQ